MTKALTSQINNLSFMFKAIILMLSILHLGGIQSASAQSESPYNLQVKREAIILGVGGVTSIAGTVLYSNTPDIALSEVKLREISSFDRIATRYSSDKAAKVSDIFFIGSAAVPFALLLDPAIRKDAGKVGLMYGEVFLLTSGFTTLIKSTTQRPRPYNYAEGLAPETILSPNDRASFLSGHTSASAAGSFFAAKVYADYHPDDNSRFIVWTAAALVPATTGYLRVRSGRHYPSDVIAGYALGASIGVLVPALHKHLPKVKSDKLSITPLPNGLYASFTF